MYDFDESGVLTLDEMVLSFRSTLSGLAKLSKIDPPTESDIEAVVVLGFNTYKKSISLTAPTTTADSSNALPDMGGIDREAFVNYCLTSPEIISWIDFFDDMEEYVIEVNSKKPLVALSLQHMTRSDDDEAVMCPSTGGMSYLELERKGKSGLRQPWENVVPLLATNSNRKQEASSPPPPSSSLPPKNIKLEWIYGCNAHSSSQCLYYSAKGHVVYAAGATCVVQDVLNNEQLYFSEHSDLVTCLKLFHVGDGSTVVATGECGRRPAIHVWDCDSRQVLATLQGFHRNGVAQLDFSPDRSRLVSLGMDRYHCVAVFDWRRRARLWAARTTSDPVADLRFLQDDIFATCGDHHVTFWTENKKHLLATTTPPRGGVVFKRYRGVLGGPHKPETHNCIGSMSDNEVVFSCSSTGMLYLWEGRAVVKAIKGHTAGILCVHIITQAGGGPGGLVTACGLGKIMLWNSKLELGATFNAASLGPVESAISSVCYDGVASKILVGFRCCQIFEMDAGDGKNVHNTGAIVSGHFRPRVGGLSVHPSLSNVFCSVGEDKALRVFDAAKRRQVKMCLLDSRARCCCFSPDGQTIVVAIGGSGVPGEEERKEGAYLVVAAEDLTLLHEARDAQGAINQIKFSPGGDKLCMASDDGCIYVYSHKKYLSKAKCRGHLGRVVSVDFCTSGRYLMSNSSAGELMFWEADSGEMQAPKGVKMLQWETNSCINSYATQGLFDPVDDGSRYNNVVKSNGQDLLVAVDNRGRVRAASYPCIDVPAAFLTRLGHAKEVLNVGMACDDSRFYTTGGGDGCIFQWKLTEIDVFKGDTVRRDEGMAVNQLLQAEMKFEGKNLEKPEYFEKVLNNDPSAACLLEEGLLGDESASSSPWLKAVVAPSRVPLEDAAEPTDALELEFVYGFSCTTSRQSLKYCSGGKEVVFFSSSVVVVMELKSRKQRFYLQHRGTVTAIDCYHQHTNTNTNTNNNSINTTTTAAPPNVVASCDQGEAPCIRVWDCDTLETLVVLAGLHRRSVGHIKFSPDGRHLVTVGQDDFHSIIVVDWRNRHVVAKSQSFTNKSLGVDFSPNGSILIQCGNEIIKFWEIQGRNLQFQDGILTSRAKMQGFLCSGWVGGHAVVGTADGCLYRFLGHKLDSIVQAHQSAVTCISYSNDGLCSSSVDGSIKVLLLLLLLLLLLMQDYQTILL